MLDHTIIRNKNANNNVNGNIATFIVSYLHIIFIQISLQFLFCFDFTAAVIRMFN